MSRFKRVELEDQQWDELKRHAEESEMELDEFLDQMGIIVEGYVKRDKEIKL